VTEHPLDKLVRLAGGVTQGYVHIVKGKPVTVSPYRTPQRARMTPLPTGPPVKQVSWGSVRPGQTIVIRSIPYKVVKVNTQSQKPHGMKLLQAAPAKGHGLPQTKGVSTGHQGSGLNTASNFAVSKAQKAQKQKRQAELFGSVNQNPQAALLQGKTPGGGHNVNAVIMQAKTGQYFNVSIPAGTMVSVMG